MRALRGGGRMPGRRAAGGEPHQGPIGPPSKLSPPTSGLEVALEPTLAVSCHRSKTVPNLWYRRSTTVNGALNPGLFCSYSASPACEQCEPCTIALRITSAG